MLQMKRPLISLSTLVYLPWEFFISIIVQGAFHKEFPNDPHREKMCSKKEE